MSDKLPEIKITKEELEKLITSEEFKQQVDKLLKINNFKPSSSYCDCPCPHCLGKKY